MSEEAGGPIRVDKWLWAARLVKTRALAAEAVKGGHVQVNGQRIKPSKDVRPGDRIELALGQAEKAVIVRGVSGRRGPAKVAELLYEETAESREARERHAAERRLEGPAGPGAGAGARPTKRDRRRLDAARSRRGR
jgi:ribosome-associated heat shock protein Hsp15